MDESVTREVNQVVLSWRARVSQESDCEKTAAALASQVAVEQSNTGNC